MNEWMANYTPIYLKGKIYWAWQISQKNTPLHCGMKFISFPLDGFVISPSKLCWYWNSRRFCSGNYHHLLWGMSSHINNWLQWKMLMQYWCIHEAWINEHSVFISQMEFLLLFSWVAPFLNTLPCLEWYLAALCKEYSMQCGIRSRLLGIRLWFWKVERILWNEEQRHQLDLCV